MTEMRHPAKRKTRDRREGCEPASGLPLLGMVLALLCHASTATADVSNVVARVETETATADHSNFVARVQADTQWLTSFGTRQVGTPAHARVQDELLAKVREIPNIQVWTQTFPVVVPVHEEVYLELGGEVLPGRHPVFALWPDVARLNTTRPEGIRGRLIYVADAAYDRLPANGLRGNIAVMELSAYEHYRRAFDFGAAAVLFLESDQAGELLTTSQSLYKPRYYVPAGPLAEALRGGTVKEGSIVCRGGWKTIQARNIYAGVKPAGTAGKVPYALVAPYDSMSLVAGVAPGADMALDCATVLNVLRDEAARPTRPLLFGFVDAYHISQLGMRQMAAMLVVTPKGRTRNEYDTLEQTELEDYRATVEELEHFDSVEAGLDGLHDRAAADRIRRTFKDAVGPQLLSLKDAQGNLRLAAHRPEANTAQVVRGQMVAALERGAALLLEVHADELTPPQRTQVEADLAYARSIVPDAAGNWPGFDETRRRAGALSEIYGDLIRPRNRVLDTVFSAKRSVDTNDLPLAKALWDRMAQRVRGQLRDQEQRIAFFEPLDRLRAQIAEQFGLDTNKAACAFVVGLDLSDCGVMVGPGTKCGYNRIAPTDRDFARALKRAVDQGDLWPEGATWRHAVNTDAIKGRVGGGGDLGKRALITSASQSFLLPGVTWVTDDAPRRRVDTPIDLANRLDWTRIEPQLHATLDFLKWVFATDGHGSANKGVEAVAAKWRHGMGRVVDVSVGETVPRVPRAGFLVTLVGSRPDTDGIRCHEFVWTGEDGSFRMPILCAEIFSYIKSFNVAAFKLDANGAIVEALTTTESMVSARLATSFDLAAKPGDRLPRAVTFDCEELNGPSFFDVRFLEPLRQGKLLDAVRGGAPKQGFFSVDLSGQMWGLVPPKTRWQLILSAGAARVRMALLNAVPDGHEKGLSLRETFQRGFPMGDALPSIPTLVAARDISVLNAWRLADFRSAGIESTKIDSIRAATAEALKTASEAIESDDGGLLQQASAKALANEIRTYQAVKDMGLDIAHGAIFLMLLLVPFCVAMERLIFACARIGRQIAASLGIFALMSAILWSFHPAFRISAQPLVIVMAFTILAMSVLVISMVLNRFKGAIREFQTALAEGSGAKMGRGGLIGSAIFLGIANMRKRKVRTLLTGTTIVLVTFALLCFSSAGSYVDKKDFRLDGAKSTAPAVMIRRPSAGPLSWSAIPALRNLLRGRDADMGERAWLSGDLGDSVWRLFVVDPRTGAQVPLRGALGLPPIEHRLTGVDRVLPDWPSFSQKGGCYLANDTASQLGVSTGDTVVVRGIDLVVRGVFDPISLEDDVALMDGGRITPYDYAQQEQDWISRDTQDAIEQELGSASTMQSGGGDADKHIPARELIVLPTEVVRRLGGTLRSVDMACQSPEDAAKVARDLSQTIVYPVFYSNAQGGVNVVVATPLVALPPRNLAIPLTLAALIIFTTMLNSVSERKSEIYVYTSLGLAPTHVGMLFVAEAVTYGLMGAVFGYVAGQGTASFLTSMGLMEGVTLNYSGTAVIRTMLLVQAVVVMSAIVPAIVAGRIASPASEMDWRVPEPVDGVIRDMLPFTVAPRAAPGLISFIHEYLEAHRDGVLGSFDVDSIRLLSEGPGGTASGLESRLWLEPYDMGVRQWMRLTVNEPDDGACAIAVEIRHEAGSPKTWWRLNKPFFTELRRQLLGWRKLSRERVLEYVARMGNVEGGA